MDGKKILKTTGKLVGGCITLMAGMGIQEILRRDDLSMAHDFPHTRVLKAVADEFRDKTAFLVREGIIMTEKEKGS